MRDRDGRQASLRFALLTLICLLAQSAYPCTCVDSGDITKRIKRYPMIFLGEVVEQTPLDREMIETTFRVTRVWKGGHLPRVALRASTNSEVCGYSFLPGHYYVVFAYTEASAWATNRCTPTEAGSKAHSLVRALDTKFRITTAIPTDREQP